MTQIFLVYSGNMLCPVAHCEILLSSLRMLVFSWALLKFLLYVSYSVHGNKYRDTQLDDVQRVRDLRARSPKLGVSIKSSTLGTREHCGRDKERVQEPEWMEHTSKIRPSRDSRNNVHRSSERLWQCAQICTGLSQVGSQKPISLTRSCILLVTAHKGNLVLSNGV